MIQFLSVSKTYPNQFTALQDVNFEVAEGEFVFLIGPSGSGKTTIIRHLIREEKPSEGRIFFDDDDITRYRRGKVYELRRKIGVIFQDYKLVDDKNAYENVAFAMEAAGKSPKDIKDTVPYVLDIVGLSGKADAFPEQLSGGEKQRVAIARAISNNPKLLIADEPTGNLDPDAAWDIVQILTKINNWGTTVLMSTHGSDIVDTLDKRVIVLDQGQIVRDAMKGKYRDEELDIAKAKIELEKQEKEQSKEEEKVKKEKVSENSDMPEQNKEKEEDIKNDEEVEPEEDIASDKEDIKAQSKQKKDKVKKEKKKKSKNTTDQKKVPDKDPIISLTQRRYKEAISSDDFEQKMRAEIEKEEQGKKQGKESAKYKHTDDLKAANFAPKLISILKAFGYDTLGSLKDAGYSKISKIEELSVKDLKTIKSVLKKVKDESSNS